MLTTLRQRLVFVPFLIQHSSVLKARSTKKEFSWLGYVELDWPAVSSPVMHQIYLHILLIYLLYLQRGLCLLFSFYSVLGLVSEKRQILLCKYSKIYQQ